MASFGWKKKAGEKVSKTVVKSFEKEAEADDDKAITSGAIDWFSLAPTKRAHVLEDAPIKSNRLQDEAATLADANRYWEALNKLDEALKFTPDSEKIYEMKAQAYMMLNELYPAVQAAEKVVQLNALWWVGHQTLGRAHLGLGEVRIAVKCFSRALHLKPDDNELWEVDLKWSVDLLKKKKLSEEDLLRAQEESQACSIKEIEEGGDNTANKSLQVVSTAGSGVKHDVESVNSMAKAKSCAKGATKRSRSEVEENTGQSLDCLVKRSRTLRGVPSGYVFMRD